MKVIVPMSGLGRRFAAAGYREIKPLIRVEGRPLIAHVVEMFPGEDDFVFVVNPDHARTTPLVETLRALKPRAAIVVEPRHEQVGPVGPTLLASDLLGDDEPVVVCYCDFFMNWDYEAFRRTVAGNGCAGAVVTYLGFHPHLLGDGLYGSLLVDDRGFMTHYREKYCWTANKMECHQSAGAYYFQKGAHVKTYFRRVLKEQDPIEGEHYVSQAFPLMVADGLPVFVYPVEHFCQWGTPHDLEQYACWSALFRRLAEDPRAFHYWRTFFHQMPWHPYRDDRHPA